MEQTEFLTALPFGGLGLDLGAVFDRAESLSFRSVKPEFGRFWGRVAPEVGRSGYGLLLWLNREIRGC